MKQLLILLFAFVCLNLSAQDLNVLGKIRDQAVNHSAVESITYQLIDQVGSRLAGSDGAERGYQTASHLMRKIGLKNVQIDFARPWHRGGWELDRAYTAMTAPYYQPIFPAIVGWTGSTEGLQEAEVILIQAADSAEFIRKYRGKLRGKIALMPSKIDYKINFGPQATRQTDESLAELQKITITAPTAHKQGFFPQFDLIGLVRGERPLAVVNESGEFNNPGITFFNHTQGNLPVAPEFNVALEAHGLMERLINNGQEVKMEIDIRTRFIADRPIQNVIGEIEGTDLKHEVVMIGAHIDSYHQSPGAGDDGAGCIVMLEAMRILKELGIQPRRTVRIALWGGEEVGLHGSMGYVNRYGDHLKDITLYLNADYGPGKFRGIFTQGNLGANSIFREWLSPLADIGCSTVSNRSVGSTDHIPFDQRGVPAFQFIQDNLEWGRGSHRTTDFSERLNMDDMRHNSVVVAWLVYCASVCDVSLPRK